jgi:carbamate kinase
VLLVLTDVSYVMRDFGRADATPIRRATPAALRREDFPAGSMGPKVNAVCRFVEVTGGMAAIGGLEDAADVLSGRAGTIVTPAGDYGGPGDLPSGSRPERDR